MSDDRQISIGAKRNKLLQMATGEYTCFIDDDDTVSANYLTSIIDGIEKTNPDAIGMMGVISIMLANGTKTRNRFYHTIRNGSYYSSNRGFERPPNHLNPIRSSITKDFRFQDTNFGEDTDWAMQIARSGRIKTEFFIEYPIYLYDYNQYKSY